MQKRDKGIIYTVYNALGNMEFFRELSISVESFRKFHPDLHITCFSDMKPDELLKLVPGIDECIQINCQILRAKVDVLKHSPYEKTLFLDTDTVFNYNVYDIFDMLDEYELVITHCLARKREKYSKCIPEYKNIPYAFSEVNTGVLGFKKCDNIDNLFDLWPKYYRKYYNVCPYDQPTFRVSLWESKARLYILPPEYNARSKQNREKQRTFHHEFGHEHLRERILHMHHKQKNLDSALQYCLENYLEY